jgi:hypothetical protein
MKKNSGLTLIETLVIVAIMLILAAIIIPGLDNSARERITAKNPTGYVVMIYNKPLVDLANEFGAEGYSSEPIGYGDALIKGHMIKDDSYPDTGPILHMRLVDHGAMKLLTDPTRSNEYRVANLRELLSLGISDNLIPDKDIVALGSEKILGTAPHGLYPVIRRGAGFKRSLSFARNEEWPEGTLFAIVKK